MPPSLERLTPLESTLRLTTLSRPLRRKKSSSAMVTSSMVKSARVRKNSRLSLTL
jgi:hypothetical protein